MARKLLHADTEVPAVRDAASVVTPVPVPLALAQPPHFAAAGGPADGTWRRHVHEDPARHAGKNQA